MLVQVREGSFLRVVHGVEMVPMGNVGMVRGLAMIASLVVLRRLTMVHGRLLVMLGGVTVVLRSLAGHLWPP